MLIGQTPKDYNSCCSFSALSNASVSPALKLQLLIVLLWAHRLYIYTMPVRWLVSGLISPAGAGLL